MPAVAQDRVEDYLDLGRWARKTPAATALSAPGREPLNYSGLWDHVRASSVAFLQAGVHPGSVAALALPNGPEFMTAALAITLQLACAPVDLSLTRTECLSFLTRLDAATLVHQEGTHSPVVDVARELGMRLIPIRCSPDAPAGVFRLGAAEPPSVERSHRQSDAAFLLMTSSTTDAPKLVPRSRDAFRAVAVQEMQMLGLSAADRLLSVMPLSHSHGMGRLVGQLSAGGSVFCTPGFDVDRFPEWLQQFGPTWFSVSPTMLRYVLALAQEKPEAFRQAPLRFIRTSSAPPDPAVLARLEELLRVPVLNGYGMTEVPSIICSTPRWRKPGSVGKVMGTQVAVMDEAGNLLPPDTEGEILLRGPTMMSGYLDDPQANRLVFHDGWIRTGDLGRLDRDGFLYLVGRRKEMINRGGKKIIPGEVDRVLAAHPAVAEAAAFPIPHPSLGEDVAAAAALRPGATVSELELRRFAAEHLAAYKVPRRIVFVDAIPRTSLGKLKRGALAEQFQDLATRARGTRAGRHEAERPPTALESQLIGIWRRVLRIDHVELEDNFFDLGGDSLSLAVMFSSVEAALHVRPLDASGFFEQPTVSSLARMLSPALAHPAEASPAPARMLLLEKEGSGVPFFCFSRSTTHPYELRHLAASLGASQPFVAVCPPPLAQEHRLLDARQIVRQAVASIRFLQNRGPYVLGGYCYGGVVAFEAARQLLEEGEDVALVVLIETPTPGYPKFVQAWRRYLTAAAGMLGSVLKGEVQVVVRDIVAHARLLGHMGARRLRGKLRRAAAAVNIPELEPDSWNRLAMQEYVPCVLGARIVHFLAAEVPVSSRVLVDRRLGWQDFAGHGFETRLVPGDHVSILAEANAPLLAAQLQAALRAAAPLLRER